ncbi:MAG: lamin tail domain-containing protein [Planctomycetota bacterium]|nr:lamin tail domain-containing protein [Planctomycetota bacterium]
MHDLSIGRIGRDGKWRLTKPTFGQANTQEPLGNPDTLKINEWLANGQVLFTDDFIELYNPHANPVDLSDMSLTDNPIMQPGKSRLGPLSFIAGKGYAVFAADDSNNPGHVNFKLSADGEMIGLFDGQLKEIDKVLYGPQTTDVSYGRSPDGSNNLEFFELPTPGVSNPGKTTTTTTITLMAESATKRVRVPTGAISDNWRGGGAFDDSGWNDGTFVSGKTGGVGYENNPGDTINYTAFISRNVGSLMYNIRGTCYIRIPFTVDANNINDITGLTLKMRYDDGFLAYINGTPLETATRNFTGTPAWNSLATSGHADSDAVNFEHISISGYIGALRSGSNILAIHGLNGTTTTSTDFLISPELEATITEVNEAFPYPEALKLLDGLRITELMYHAPDGSAYDYIELYNIGNITLDLNGVRITQGIDFTFPPMTLASGRYVVVVSNIAAFQSRYGSSASVAGQYSGNLSNAGEDIVLKLPFPLEAAILRFRYSDALYPTTDGSGDSLTIREPTAHPATWDWLESWQAASPTPGGP